MSYRGRIAKLFLAIVFICLGSGAMAQSWWDAGFAFRVPATVTTSADLPDKGYQGYTARIDSFDTATLIAAGDMQSNCNDLRLVYWNGTANTEIPRHLINCDTTSSDIRFAIQTAQAASTADAGYYFYYGNSAASAPPAVTPTNVYLWYDDASVDRIANYDRGRGDNWHGDGYSNSLQYNANGYYTYDTGDNFTETFRIPVDERDVYVESEFFHTSCYPSNMTTGVILRGIINSGTGGSENSNHYYAGQRGHNQACGNGYTGDGDIVEGNRTTTAVDGANPPAIATSAWRRMGLSAWSVNVTNLAYYDHTIDFGDMSAYNESLGFPAASNLITSGTDANDKEGRGFAGVIAAQDSARVRNILIRRYVGTEPVVTLGPVEIGAIDLTTVKTVLSPTPPNFAAMTDTVTFRIQVTNNATSTSASNVTLTDILPVGISHTTDTGGGDYNPISGVWDIGTLGPNASVTLDISGTVGTGTAGTTITNQTTKAVATQTDPTDVGNTLEASVTIANPLLDVVKTHAFVSDPLNDGLAGTGDIIRYTYRVINTGNVSFNDISLTDITNSFGDQPNDNADAELAHPASGGLVDVAPLGDSVDNDGANNIWTTLGPGDEITFTWDYTVTQNDVDALQ